MLLAAVLVAGCGESATPSGGAAAGASDAAQGASVKIPDVTGDDAGEARDALEEMKFLVTLDPPSDPGGCIVGQQDPRAGETVAAETEVTITVDCRQVEWESQEGQDWDAYTTGYSTGFTRACKALFALPAGGVLLESDSSEEVGGRHDEAECRNEAVSADDPPSGVPDDPERTGEKQGVKAGCQTPFELASADVLFDGSQEYTAQDCRDAVEAAKDAPPASRGRKRKQEPSTAPESKSYRVRRAEWNALGPERRLQAATSFLADHPEDCGAAGLNAGELRDQADGVLGGPGDADVNVDGVMLAVCRGGTGGG